MYWTEADDLTARSRIREAAVQLFAERGVAGTTIRDVARAAGVSGGLVQHYFGTKEALRRACDAHVLAQLVLLKEEVLGTGRGGGPFAFSDAHPRIVALTRYLARSMVDGSESAADMFDQIVRATETWLATHHAGRFRDVHGVAALVVAMEMGVLAVHELLSATLGADVLGPEGHLRLARAKVELYSAPLLDEPPHDDEPPDDERSAP